MASPHTRTGALRTKPIERILEQQSDEAAAAKESGGGLRKNLTSRDLMGFGIGIVIGTGIFTLTGIEAKNHAGPGVVISFGIAGLVSLLAALCYAEMASTVPTAGSAYTYAYATIGEVFAWIIGWDLILEFALGAAVVARGWSGYLANLFDLPPSLFTEAARVNVGAIGITIVLGIIAMVGVKESARVTGALVVIKVAVCLFVIVAGLFFVKGANLTPFIPTARAVSSDTSGIKQPLSQALFGIQPTAFGFAGVLTAAAVVFFAYTGFEAVANMGEETRNPKKDLPLGLLGTLGICTVLYIGVSFVITGMQKYSEISESAPIAGAFDSVGLGWASALISIAAVCGLTSVILVDIIAMGRIGFAMGRDNLLPPTVAAIHPKWGTPWKITIATIVLVCLLGGLVPLSALADMVSIGTLFAFVVVSVAVPIMRHRRPELERPFRVPFSPVIPALSALACVYLMTNLSLETWLRFVVWMALGFLIYFSYGKRNASIQTWHQHEPVSTAKRP